MTGPDQHQDDKTAVFGRTTAIEPKAAIKGGGATAAKLICLEKDKLPDPTVGAEIDLIDKEQTIGRTAEHNTVPINATGISKKHARVYFENGAWRVEDLGSTNGIHVNEAKVQNSPLAPGDTVKIGKIKFQFVLVRPDIKAAAVDKDGRKHEEFDPDKTVSERTMFVGSNLMAAAMLLDAKAKQEQAAAKPAGPARGRMAAAQAAPVKPKGGGFGKAIAAVILLAAIGGGVYWFGGFRGGVSEAELASGFQADVKRFVRDNEDGGDTYSGKAHEQQSTELLNLKSGINEALGQFPESEKLAAIQARVIFLILEREMQNALLNGNPDAGQQALDMARSEFEKPKAIGAAVKDAELKKVFGEVAGLLDLAVPVVQIKQFVKQFPTPSKDADPKPGQADLDRIVKARAGFSELKKKNNLALSVSFPFFNSVVKVVDEKDVIVIDKWGSVLSGK